MVPFAYLIVLIIIIDNLNVSNARRKSNCSKLTITTEIPSFKSILVQQYNSVLMEFLLKRDSILEEH